MALLARWCALFLLAAPCLAARGAEAPPPASARPPTVNPFTAPPIGQLLQKITALQPIPLDKVWRDPPVRAPQDRLRLALLTGSVLADGFLVVSCERRARLDPVGRSLLRCAKALGFGERLSPRGRRIIELAEKERWAEVRRELVKAQAEAEDALRQLKDDDLVQLLALGGWLRGLEITSGAILTDYTVERSRLLYEPELAAYFLERLSALPARARATLLIKKLERSLRAMSDIVSHGQERALTEGEVKRLLLLSRSANDLMALEE